MKLTSWLAVALCALGCGLAAPLLEELSPEARYRAAAALGCLVVATLAYYEGERWLGQDSGEGEEGSKVPQDLGEFIVREEEKSDTPGDIDGYENVYDVKSGGFSRVKQVRRTTTKEVYALKLTNIHRAFDEGQVSHTLNEKEILSSVDHPFIVKLYTTFKDTNYVYFLLEFVGGGELFDVIKKEKKLKVEAAKFYAANVIAALEYLHGKKIAFRDLKSENLLLDRQGYLKVIDFGMSRFVHDKCHTFAGTLDYVSPELLSMDPYTEHVDWWALGCLVYEMLTGSTPFKGTEEERLEAMRAHSIRFEDDFDPVARDLVERLLHPKYSKRLGTGSNAGVQIRSHPWFKGFDWAALMKRQMDAPKFDSGMPKLSLITPKKLVTRSLSVRAAVEAEPPESPRTYSPTAIDTFFKGF
ncbi:serine/threonine-protein kinase [Chloropicon primus]|uniref:Serine/threonine-protein kinase n=1 Tax=Chloropicon primus TaxID=1764295 RepID=A0A5B8MT85_9CHLO|nr:serine/threonine-protein kinase [Chloropicon primus]UPR02739.1 serine/threonine-protein kinase [Chloropicon primus]|eukprot:QDZ23527.1 serine/threonine-protein kinase [Chloropicon primus]